MALSKTFIPTLAIVAANNYFIAKPETMPANQARAQNATSGSTVSC